MNINTELVVKQKDRWDENFDIPLTRLDELHRMVTEELDSFKDAGVFLEPEIAAVAIERTINKLLLEPEPKLKEMIYIAFKTGFSTAMAASISRENPIMSMMKAISKLKDHLKEKEAPKNSEDEDITQNLN